MAEMWYPEQPSALQILLDGTGELWKNQVLTYSSLLYDSGISSCVKYRGKFMAR